VTGTTLAPLGAMGQVKTRFEMSVFDVLMVEHRDVEALFEQIEAICEDSPEEARDLFTVLADSLLGHAKAEQAVVYPRLAKIAELEDKMMEAEAEHEAVEMLIDHLSATTPDGEHGLARLAVLKENVTHHVREEENEVFPKGRESIDAAEQQRLAASYLRAKARRTGGAETDDARGRKPPAKKGLWARILG
jgi:hemerythrin superfamily protein